MIFLRNALNRSAFVARVAPFIIFVSLTALQGRFGPASYYWIYCAKTFVGLFLVWTMWPIVTEMRWAFSWEAVVIGVFVAAFWVGLDPFCPKWFKVDHAYNPHTDLATNGSLALGYIMIRIAGSTLIVPLLEEVFFRSFLYRYIIKADFISIPLNHFNLRSFLITSILFGLEHGNQWIAGILCGFCYQWLVLRKNRLGDAMTAHAISNLLLGLYVAWKAQWQFW
jgi:CAAX prenyl protease-like protein